MCGTEMLSKSPNSGRNWAELGRDWLDSDRFRAKFARSDSNEAQLWPNYRQHQQALVGLDGIGADFGQILAYMDRIWATVFRIWPE